MRKIIFLLSVSIFAFFQTYNHYAPQHVPQIYYGGLMLLCTLWVSVGYCIYQKKGSGSAIVALIFSFFVTYAATNVYARHENEFNPFAVVAISFGTSLILVILQLLQFPFSDAKSRRLS